MKYNLEGKIFRSIANTENGEVTEDTLFHYHQNGDVVSAEYEGGAILKGHLLAKVMSDDRLDMRYHHVNTSGKLMTGRCISTPEFMTDGRLKFKEEWQWLSGDLSSGYSEVEEIDSL